MTQQSGSGNVLRRRRRELTDYELSELPSRWHAVLHSYKSGEQGYQGDMTYPRWQKLFDIIREDGRIKLLLDYDQENPSPDFRDYGQRRQVESMLGFERPLEQLMIEAGKRWLDGDFDGEATLLEEFAESNPQKDAILDLAAEARRDSVTGASAPKRPKRRELH